MHIPRLLAVALLAVAGAASAAQPVPPFPRPAVLPPPPHSGYVGVDGVRLWYAEFGAGPPVVLIEGGLDSTADWGDLAPYLAAHGYRAIVFDSRCQGHSTCSSVRLTYRLMARDTTGLMRALHIRRAPIVGYSDGGIIGLEMAIHEPRRVVSVFAYGANANPTAIRRHESAAQRRVDAASALWSRRVYQASSPTPRDFAAIAQRIERMWDTQPHLTRARLETIRVPVWIVDGDRDIIRRSDTDFMARSMPLGSELILPFASHYALWEYPSFFNAAVLQFLVSTDPQHAGTR